METKAISTTEKVEDLSKRIEAIKSRTDAVNLIDENLEACLSDTICLKEANTNLSAISKKMKVIKT